MNKGLGTLLELQKVLEDASLKFDEASLKDAKFRENINNRISCIENFLFEKFGFEIKNSGDEEE